MPLLRWTHNDIEEHMYFRHNPCGPTLPVEERKSMYETLDDLLRGEMTPADKQPFALQPGFI